YKMETYRGTLSRYSQDEEAYHLTVLPFVPGNAQPPLQTFELKKDYFKEGKSQLYVYEGQTLVSSIKTLPDLFNYYAEQRREVPENIPYTELTILENLK